MPEPAPERIEATRQVVGAGQAAAETAGLRCLVEFSPGSESAYLHVLREGVWRGVRVSCHAAVYDCSLDYEQLLLPEAPDAEALAGATIAIEHLALRGGAVVADPDEVAEAVDKIASVMADGRVYQDADGTRWRWSADDEAWRVVGRFWGEGEPVPPTHRPNPAVSARIRCQVRHAQNDTARRAAEQQGAG